ncbi:MAG TPA: ABC transporter permease, partial [Paenisporosarcina sp.]|nr:ABC transporter permease [Paenisporosarcina sp.]
MTFLEILYFIVPVAIAYAAPLILTAIGGVFSERSGVVNIGLEGLMVIGAFIGVIFNLTFVDIFGSSTPYIALLAAMVVASLFSLFHAVASVSFRADQVVSGVAINLLAVALCLFLVKKIYGKGQTDFVQETFLRNDIWILEKIPFLGPMFFQNVYWTSVLAIGIAILAWVVLYYTPFGL